MDLVKFLFVHLELRYAKMAKNNKAYWQIVQHNLCTKVVTFFLL